MASGSFDIASDFESLKPRLLRPAVAPAASTGTRDPLAPKPPDYLRTALQPYARGAETLLGGLGAGGQMFTSGLGMLERALGGQEYTGPEGLPEPSPTGPLAGPLGFGFGLPGIAAGSFGHAARGLRSLAPGIEAAREVPAMRPLLSARGAVGETPKQPWEMTWDEWRSSRGVDPRLVNIAERVSDVTRGARKRPSPGEMRELVKSGLAKEIIDTIGRTTVLTEDARQMAIGHRMAVVAAVREGKLVPAEVLKAYPDFVPPTPAPSLASERGAVALPEMRPSFTPSTATEPSRFGPSVQVVEPPAPPVPPRPVASGLPEPSPGQQPLAPTTRVQQFPNAADVVKQIESDPEYLKRIDELGGGRRVTNRETFAQALSEGPMNPDEIAAWPAHTPVNHVQVARAALTKDWIERKWVRALEAGNAAESDAAAAELKRLLPGYNNLTATPGRATQVQATFAEDRLHVLYDDIRELQDKGLPFDQVSKALQEKFRSVMRERGLEKAGERANSLIRALETYATAAKLTSPVTHEVNTVSNTLTYLQRAAERGVVAGQALAKGEPERAAATLKYAFGTHQGFVDGARKFLKTLTDPIQSVSFKAEVPISEKAGRVYPLPMRLANPFRWLSAADNFWKAIIVDSELNTMAYASAAKSGLTGDKLAARVTELISDPPLPWLKKAQGVAREFTFQEDPDRFLQAASTLRNLPGGRFVVPFIQTPYNITKFQAQRSALGVLSRRNLRGLASGGKEQEEAVARLAIGAGLSVAAWQLAARGDVTGAYPTDPKERALWEAEGRTPYSVKIGNRRLAYNRFQPLGLYLTQAAALHDALQGGDLKQAGTIYTRLAAQTGKAVLDMPFVQGMSSLLDAIQDPARSLSRFTGGTLTGFIPNILRDVRYQTDPIKRESRGIGPQIINMLPGQSQRLEPKIDVLGRTERYDPNRLIRSQKVLSPSQGDEVTKVMRAAKYSPSEPVPEVTRRGKTVKLTGRDATRFQQEMGEATRTAIIGASSSPHFAGMDVEDRKDRLDDAVRRARSRVRKRWQHQVVAQPSQPAAVVKQAVGFDIAEDWAATK